MRAGQIFLSYSRIDEKFALKLGEDLRKAGVDIWIDQIDIPPSEPWDEEIEKALGESNCLLVILSQTSVASDNVLNEINFALESKKQVLPIVLESNIKKPFNIGRLQHIDFTGSYENAFNLLLAALKLRRPVPVKKEISYRTAIRLSIFAVIIIIAAWLVKINFFNTVVPESNKQTGHLTTSQIQIVTGSWLSEEITNPFDDRNKYKIYFDLEALGEIIVGNLRLVSTVEGNEYSVKKGFLDGKLKDNVVSFYTIEEQTSGHGIETYKNLYYGSVSKNEIAFTLQSDRPTGFPGQKFIAKRLAASPAE